MKDLGRQRRAAENSRKQIYYVHRTSNRKT